MDSGSQPKRGSRLKARLKIATALSLVSLLIAGALSGQAVRQARLARSEMLEAQGVLAATDVVQLAYAQLISDVRAYVISNQPRFLDDYRRHRGEVETSFAELRARAGGDPRQAALLQEAQAALDERLVQLEQAIADFDAGGIQAIQRSADDPRVSRYLQRFPEILGEVARMERDRVAARAESEARSQDRLVWVVAALLTLSVGIAVWQSFRLLRAVAARSEAERQARLERRFAEQVIENLPLALYMKDVVASRLVRVNRAVEKLAGRPRETILGRDCDQFFEEGKGAAYLERERAFIQRGGEEIEEVEIATPAGPRMVSVRRVLLKDEQGRPRYVLGTAADITERLENERRLREFSADLAEKTRALEAANRELESFSYTVSHDLRAPLRAVDGYAAMLEEDYGRQFDEEGRRYLRALREGATRMGRLIEDLLTFSRLGRQVLEPGTVETGSLVESAWQAALEANPGSAAVLEVGPLPPTRGDALLLRQVWINLLDNAVKYSSRTAAPRIQVRGEESGTETVFHVTDNGAGFDMRYYDKLFQVFQRLHSENDFPGTGVGLAIVQRIVARHGGRVWASSQPGQGAVFSFALPVPS